jgi:hypothetical protein
MELLPIEVIELIGEELSVKDKQQFIRTCKKYHSSKIMKNVKYVIFRTSGCFEGQDENEMKGIYDNIFLCKQHIKKHLVTNPITRPSHILMTKENDYTLLMYRNDDYGFRYASDGFIIEPVSLNTFDY